MATKGVLGNDPFQRGAAQRSKQPEPQSPARPQPEQAARAAPTKKAPRSRPSARSATSTPAASKPKAPEAPKAPPAPKPRKQAAAARKASRPQPQEPKSLVEVPQSLREPAAPAVVPAPAEPPAAPLRQEPPAAEAEAAPLRREPPAEAVPAPAAAEPRPEPVWRLREEGLEVQQAQGAEQPQAMASQAQVEVPDASQDEYPPGSRQEAVVEARVAIEVEAALAPAAAVSGHGEPSDTSQYESSDTSAAPSARRSLLARLREVADEAVGGSSVLRRSLGALQGVAGAVRAGIGLGGSTALDEYGRDEALVRELEPLVDFLYESYWRITVQGAEHVPAGATLLVANHSGALPFDGPMLAEAVRRERPELREARWLVEDQVFYSPVLGTLFNRLGAVRACPENALRLLDEQRPLLVFPEGFQGLSKPFAQRYQLKRFGRGGFVKLALRTGAPIVPVAIVGAEESSPLLARLPSGFLGLPYLPLTPLGPLPLPARWFIRFGEPITAEGLPPEAAEDTVQVQRLTERTRDAIHSMLQELLAERRSVFTG